MPKKELNVKLLRYTPNPEEVVAMGARLCYSAADIEQLATGISISDQGQFIKKLMEMGHQSPLEHVSFTFGIEGVSRSLLAQVTRHRLASFSVQSQRYVGETSAQHKGQTFGYIIPKRIKELGSEAIADFEEQMATMQKWYDEWVEKLGGGRGVYEDARFVLPNAAETKLVATMNARELLHFFNLRCCNRAQWEIRAMADAMLVAVKKVAPILFAQGGPGCVRGACPEVKMTCGKIEETRKKYQELSNN